MIRLYAIVGAAVLLCAASFYLGTLYSHGRLEARIAAEERLIAQANAAQLNRERDYATRLAAANTQHADDLAAIGLRRVSVPVYRLRDGQICTAHLPVPAPAVPASAPGGTVQPGLGGVDIRPGLESFKARYETALADCRANLAAWPK